MWSKKRDKHKNVKPSLKSGYFECITAQNVQTHVHIFQFFVLVFWTRRDALFETHRPSSTASESTRIQFPTDAAGLFSFSFAFFFTTANRGPPKNRIRFLENLTHWQTTAENGPRQRAFKVERLETQNWPVRCSEYMMHLCIRPSFCEICAFEVLISALFHLKSVEWTDVVVSEYTFANKTSIERQVDSWLCTWRSFFEEWCCVLRWCLWHVLLGAEMGTKSIRTVAGIECTMDYNRYSKDSKDKQNPVIYFPNT